MIELKRPQLAASDVPDINTQVTYPKWIQRKYDGVACLAVSGVAMSRTMKPIPNLFIQKFFAENKLHGWQGELMLNGDFSAVQSGVMRIEGEPDFFYVVYDKWDTEDPYWKRLGQLAVFLEYPLERIQVVETRVVDNVEECEATLEEFVNEGFEGAMLRDRDSLYKQGRHTLKSQALMKLKRFEDDEAVIIGVEEKLHNENVEEVNELGYTKRSSKKEGMVPAGTLGALVVKWKDVEFSIGSGYNDQQRQELWDTRESLIGKLVTFKMQGIGSKGRPRFPIFRAIRHPLDIL